MCIYTWESIVFILIVLFSFCSNRSSILMPMSISMPILIPILMPVSHLRYIVLLLHSNCSSDGSFLLLSSWVLLVASSFHYVGWFLQLLLLMGLSLSSNSEPIFFLILFPPTDDVNCIFIRLQFFLVSVPSSFPVGFDSEMTFVISTSLWSTFPQCWSRPFLLLFFSGLVNFIAVVLILCHNCIPLW